jgi:hypothetical protein
MEVTNRLHERTYFDNPWSLNKSEFHRLFREEFAKKISTHLRSFVIALRPFAICSLLESAETISPQNVLGEEFR